VSEAVVPRSFSEAAATLAGAAAQQRPVRIVGGATKLGWGGGQPPRALRLLTTHLSRVVVHDDGQSATINAGTPLLRAQALLARNGVMLAADPHLGLGRQRAATVGGVVATADCGPLSHRYGPVRDQVVGITAALGDGSTIRTGPRHVAAREGYDMAKLLTGSFGTLGLVLAVDVRVWPLPRSTATAIGTTDDPSRLCEAAIGIAGEHGGLEAFDFAWHSGRGGLLAQLSGDGAASAATTVAETMRACGLQNTAVRSDDAGLWARQRAGQRSAEQAVLRIHAHRDQLDVLLRLADAANATVVGRAALGVAYLTLAASEIASVRAGLPDGAAAVVLDLPAGARGSIDPWGALEQPLLELTGALKRRFDPSGVCNQGIFVGGI
jgi:glycolate oxidase FAD binding subunit